MQGTQIPLNVAIVGIISLLAFILAALLFLRKGKNQKADLFLSLFFFAFSLGYLLQIGRYGNYLPTVDWQFVAYPFGFAATSFLFFFVQSSLKENYPNQKQIIRYLFPFGITLLMVGLYFFNLFPNSIKDHLNGGLGFLLSELFIVLLTIINIKTILRYREYILQHETILQKKRYSWIRFIVFASLIFSVFPFVWGLFGYVLNIPIQSQISYLIAGLITVTYLLIILIKTIQNSHLTSPLNEDQLSSTFTKKEKVLKPSNEEKALYNKTKTFLESSKYYKEPELRLNDLAEKMEVPNRDLSKVINLCSQANFYEFINDLRINEVKHILSINPDPKLTISEVMYDVGYNSKSSFNTAFKKRIGITPLQYRKKMLEEIGSNT